MGERIKTIIAALCFGIFTTVFLVGPAALFYERMEQWKIADALFSDYACLFIGGIVTGLYMGKKWPGKGPWDFLICALVSPGIYWAMLPLLTIPSPGEESIPILRAILWISLPMFSALVTMAIFRIKALSSLCVIGLSKAEHNKSD